MTSSSNDAGDAAQDGVQEPVERPLGDTAARGTGMTLLTQGARAVLQFGSVVVLARLLTPDDFGLIAMVTAVIGISDLVRDFGLSSASIQVKSLSDAERSNLFWANLALGLACTLVCAAATPLIVAGYGERRLTPIVLSLAGVFVLSGANTQFRADLTRRLRFTALSVSDVVAQLAGIVVAVAVAELGGGFWAIVLQQVTVAVVALAINVVNAGWLPGRPRRDVPLRRFFRYGGSLLGTQSIYYATKNVDNIALGAFSGAVQLGLYSRAYQLLMTPLNTINAPMTRVALPVLSRLQDDEAAFGSALGKMQIVACYLTATVFAVAAGLSVPLVLVLFGPAWHPVALIFAVLAVGGVFRALSQISYWVYLARGVPGAQLRQFLVTGPIMVLVILAGLPWGPVGVAVGHSVAYFFQWLVSLVHAGRSARVDTRPLLRKAVFAMLVVSAPSGLAAFLGGRVPAAPVVQLLAGCACAAGYVVVAAAVVPPLRADARVVLGFGRRALGRS